MGPDYRLHRPSTAPCSAAARSTRIPPTPNWAWFFDPQLDNLGQPGAGRTTYDPTAPGAAMGARGPHLPPTRHHSSRLQRRNVDRVRLLPGANYQVSPLNTGPCSTRCGSGSGSLGACSAGPEPVPATRSPSHEGPGRAGRRRDAHRRKPPRAHLIPSAIDYEGLYVLYLALPDVTRCGHGMPRSRGVLWGPRPLERVGQ